MPKTIDIERYKSRAVAEWQAANDRFEEEKKTYELRMKEVAWMEGEAGKEMLFNKEKNADLPRPDRSGEPRALTVQFAEGPSGEPIGLTKAVREFIRTAPHQFDMNQVVEATSKMNINGKTTRDNYSTALLRMEKEEKLVKKIRTGTIKVPALYVKV